MKSKMAMVKAVKIVAGQVKRIDSTTDELSLLGISVGGNGVTLTGGGDVTAAAGSVLSGFDSIEGILSANLVDKTAIESITGAWSFSEANFTILKFSGTALTSTFGELNQLHGISTNVTAANLNTLTAGATSVADSLHTHASLIADVTFNATGGETLGIAAGKAVYLSANNTVMLANASAAATAECVGIAEAAIASAATGKITFVGVCAGVGTGWTVGKPVFLDQTAGGLTQADPSAFGAIKQLGVALNATDLLLWISPTIL